MIFCSTCLNVNRLCAYFTIKIPCACDHKDATNIIETHALTCCSVFVQDKLKWFSTFAKYHCEITMHSDVISYVSN